MKVAKSPFSVYAVNRKLDLVLLEDDRVLEIVAYIDGVGNVAPKDEAIYAVVVDGAETRRVRLSDYTKYQEVH